MQEGNIIDFITGEIIPDDRLITIVEGETKYCFDVKTIYREYLRTNKVSILFI